MDQVELLKIYAVKLASRLVKAIYDYEGSPAHKQFPRRTYASVSVSIEEGYSFDFSRGVAYTYFPDIEKLLEQL